MNERDHGDGRLVLVATPVLGRVLKIRGAKAAIDTTPTITKSYGSGETMS